MKALNIIFEDACNTSETGFFRIEDREIIEKYCDFYYDEWANGYDEEIYIEEYDDVSAEKIIAFNSENVFDYEGFMEYLKNNS